MCIYICSFWAGETRFLGPCILVWDQLVLARVLHGEFCGESLGLVSWVRRRELRPVRRWNTLSSAVLETKGLMNLTRYPQFFTGATAHFS